VVQFQIVGEYDFEAFEYNDVAAEELESRGYFCLTGKDHKILMGADQVHDAFGWGGSIEELRTADYGETPVVIVIEEDNYNNKPSMKIKSLHNADVDPKNIGGIVALAPERVAKIDAMHSASLIAHFGGAKPKSVPPKKTVKPKTPKPDAGAVKAAAKAEVEEKKARAAAAEEKSQLPSEAATTTPPKKPVIPKVQTPLPTAAPEAVEPEVTEIAETAIPVADNITKNDAYALVAEHILGDVVTKEHPEGEPKVNVVWGGVVEEAGFDVGVDATDHGWALVARACLAKA
jgi:hypothetical protein